MSEMKNETRLMTKSVRSVKSVGFRRESRRASAGTSSVVVASATATKLLLNPNPRKRESNPIRENVTMSDPTLKAPNQEKPTRPIQYKRT